jgi:hypothetical protein
MIFLHSSLPPPRQARAHSSNQIKDHKAVQDQAGRVAATLDGGEAMGHLFIAA